jgi:hypothetical protein
MIYTFFERTDGENFIRSRSSLISSIPRLLAASISKTSTAVPFVIEIHAEHLLHGSILNGSLCFLFSQFIALAKILAEDVFPSPFGPANKNACGIDFEERIAESLLRTSTRSSSEINC